MQFLDVISVNIWAIIASLANLLLLTWIIKKFLFKPVKKIVDARRAAIDEDYAQAKAAREEAEETKRNYDEAMAAAKMTGDQIIADANRTAEFRSNEIVAEARERASEIRRQAEADAVLERKKAEDEMKHEIANVSAQLTGKLLQRDSVSRVGGAAQIKALKKVAGSLKLLYSQYRELQSFAQFGSDLDQDTKDRLAQGARIVEVLKQSNNAPVPVELQVCIIYAVVNGYLKDIEVAQVHEFEQGLFRYLDTHAHKLLRSIVETKVLPEQSEEELKQALTAYIGEFKKSH